MTAFSVENLENRVLAIEVGPDTDHTADSNEAGRMVYAIVWNQHGKVGMYEFPVQIGKEQRFEVTLPANPPYLFRAFSTAVSSIIKYVVFPGNWTGLGATAALFLGDWTVDVSPRNNTLWGQVSVPVGSTEGLWTGALPDQMLYLNSGLVSNRTGATRGNYTIVDPLGRLNFAYDNTGLTGTDVYVWGFPPRAGEWRVTLRLPQPALEETVWPVYFEEHFVSDLILEMGGFPQTSRPERPWSRALFFSKLRLAACFAR